MADVGPIPLFCLHGQPHCWHDAERQHAGSVPGGVHLDSTCCWCGGSACRDVRSRSGHGRHLPATHSTGAARRALAILREKSAKDPRKSPLTESQRDLLRLLAAGQRPREAAKTVGVTLKAVRLRLEHVRKRLNTKTTMQAVAVAARNGFI